MRVCPWLQSNWGGWCEGVISDEFSFLLLLPPLGLSCTQVLENKPEFKEYLNNPTVSRDGKVAAIEEMFGVPGKGKGKKISPVTQNLVVAMAGNNRVGDAGKVADAYVQLMKAKRGETDAIITSAAALDAKQLAFITDILKKQAGGKNVSITTQVNPEIVGGLQLQIGDQFLDLSVKSRIQTLSATLQAS